MAVFICNSCEGELVLEENGIKVILEDNPVSFGKIEKRRTRQKATCTKCGKVDEDYFKMF